MECVSYIAKAVGRDAFRGDALEVSNMFLAMMSKLLQPFARLTWCRRLPRACFLARLK